MSEGSTYFYLASALVVGFGWGKVSSRLPIPEVLRLLGTFFCTGLLGVLFGFVVGVVQLITRPPRVEALLTNLEFLPLVKATTSFACFCFLAGAVLGGPAVLGFAFGYQRPTPGTFRSARCPTPGARSVR